MRLQAALSCLSTSPALEPSAHSYPVSSPSNPDHLNIHTCYTPKPRHSLHLFILFLNIHRLSNSTDHQQQQQQAPLAG